MEDQDEPPLDDRRQELLRQKLGALLKWRAPKLVSTVGPFDPEVFEFCTSRRRNLVEKCSAKLLAHSEAEIEAMLDERHADHKQLRREWFSFLGEAVSSASRLPPWYAGGFGHPGHVADFEYWAKMPNFSIEEATCLSLGIEPKEFQADELAKLRGHDPAKQWQPIRYLLKTHDLLDRKFNPQKHGWRVLPREFLTWMDQVAFEAHPEFVRLLRQYHVVPPGSEAREGADGPDTVAKPDKREVDMMAQLFTAIVIDSYGYRPRDSRSPIPREIADIVASIGLSVSDDTVRKYLKRGAAMLPKDREPE